jgi:hypothetical protein
MKAKLFQWTPEEVCRFGMWLILGCEAFEIHQSIQRGEVEIRGAKNGNDHQSLQVS